MSGQNKQEPNPPPRLRLRVTASAESIIRQGHPWLFADSIRDQNRPGTLGDLAVLFDRNNRFLAIGLYDPSSPIRVRILHRGKPQTIDAGWWERQFTASFLRRRGLFQPHTTGFRLVHGESDGWPGLVLDHYAGALVLKLYTAAWFPHLTTLVQLLVKTLPETAPAASLILRLSRNIQSIAQSNFALQDGQILSGPDLTTPVVFQENGLSFEADVRKGQKTGFFLDQRENRRIIESLSADRDVLNAFSFSGGFSLYAARGGAKSVSDLDISGHALEAAKRNFDLNRSDPQIARCPRRVIQANAFEWLQQSLEPRFDLVILDPPALAKRAAEKPAALQAYLNLAKNGLTRLRPGGLLAAASCSAQITPAEFFAAIHRALSLSQRPFKEIRRTSHPPDHPAAFKEAEYLKCIYLQLEPR